jgi:hypothetical protein
VVIPSGQNILLDVSPPRLFLLLIMGRLTVEDTRDATLDASYIFVRGVGASFTVGTELAPFTHKAIITLHGQSKVTPELPLYGAKVIAVRRGTLDLHGEGGWMQAYSNRLNLHSVLDWELKP